MAAVDHSCARIESDGYAQSFRYLLVAHAEFHRFGDLGVFEGRRAMLIDGVILEEGPMNPPHAITLGLVEEAIRTAFGAGWWTSTGGG